MNDETRVAVEVVIADKRMECEMPIRSYVEGYGEVRFMLSAYKKRCSARMGRGVIPMDDALRAEGKRLVEKYLAELT